MIIESIFVEITYEMTTIFDKSENPQHRSFTVSDKRQIGGGLIIGLSVRSRRDKIVINLIKQQASASAVSVCNAIILLVEFAILDNRYKSK